MNLSNEKKIINANYVNGRTKMKRLFCRREYKTNCNGGHEMMKLEPRSVDIQID